MLDANEAFMEQRDVHTFRKAAMKTKAPLNEEKMSRHAKKELHLLPPV